MQKIIALFCLTVLCIVFAYSAGAARKREFNPFVACGQKLDKIKNRAPATILAAARAACLADPAGFNGFTFLAKDPNAQCERKIEPIVSRNESAEMVGLARAECLKDPGVFNSVKFERDYNICDIKAKSMVSLWKGFRTLARQECVGLEDPTEFSRSEFTKRNVNPPGAAPASNQ